MKTQHSLKKKLFLKPTVIWCSLLSPSSSFTTSCFAPVILKCSQFLTPGEGNGNPLQSSYLENPMDGEAWRAPVHGVTESQTRLND